MSATDREDKLSATVDIPEDFPSSHAAELPMSASMHQEFQWEVADANKVIKRFYEIEPQYSKLFERLAKL